MMVGISLSLEAVLVAAGLPPGSELTGVASGRLQAAFEGRKFSPPAMGELFADLLTPFRSFFFLLRGELQPLWRSADSDLRLE